MVDTSKGFLLFYCTVQRGTLKKLQQNSNNRNHEDHFPLAIIAWTMFQVQFRPYLFMSISESDFSHYYYQSLSSDKTNVSAPWIGEQDFFFPQETYINVSKREEKREWNISQTGFIWSISDFDIQKKWVSVWLHGTITRKTFHSYLR